MPVKTRTKYPQARKYKYIPRLRIKYLVDEYNEPYYLHDPTDRVQIYSLSLPRSLMKKIDETRKNEGKSVTRSRFVRKILEDELGITRKIIT